MSRLTITPQGRHGFTAHSAWPANCRIRPQRWADAVPTLAHLIDGYQAWRDGLPPSLMANGIAQRLDDVVGLRDLGVWY